MPALHLAAEAPAPLTIDLLIVLGVAAAIAMVLQRLRLAVVPAYLIAGALVGPGALGLVASTESLDSIGKLAIVLLMFGVGMELHVAALRRGAAWLIGAGALSVAGAVALGWPAAMLFGLPAPAALLVAMALSLSSTAVVLRIMAQRRELHHTTGRLTFAILIIQDLVVVGMLAAVPSIAAWADGGGAAAAHADPDAPGPLVATGLALARVAGVAALVIVGRVALPRILFEAAKAGSVEVMTVISVAAAIAAGVATQALGFSAALGAFLAGFVLSATPFRHQLSGQIGPARDLFVAVFFTTLGMQLEMGVVAELWWVILLGGLAMSLIKGVAIGGSCWLMGAPPAGAIIVALALSQAGEFSLIVFEAARTHSILSPAAESAVIAVVVLSLVLTPVLMGLGRAVAPRLGWAPRTPWMNRSPLRHAAEEPVEPAAAQVESATLRAIVGGFGPIGRAVAERLEEAGVKHTVIELNPRTVRAEDERGRSIIYGDVGSEEVLRSAGVDRADALILTVPDVDAAARACQAARRLKPDIFILCRAPLLARQALARGQGADVIVIDELAAARAMQREVLRALAKRRRAAQRQQTPASDADAAQRAAQPDESAEADAREHRE